LVPLSDVVCGRCCAARRRFAEGVGVSPPADDAGAVVVAFVATGVVSFSDVAGVASFPHDTTSAAVQISITTAIISATILFIFSSRVILF
jgi:hypothetical protein